MNARTQTNGRRPPDGIRRNKGVPLQGRDQAIYLLHTAAEIEHSLMVQYLYAAFTLDSRHPKFAWTRSELLSIAKEEMGHFLTLQNILILIGGPLNFDREDTPFRSDIYPFPFSLEPLSLAKPAAVTKWDPRHNTLQNGSLNKYIAAEMPSKVDENLKGIVPKGDRINRVGEVFVELIDLFDSKDKLIDSDFLSGAKGRQADERDWRRSGPTQDILVLSPHDRKTVTNALRRVAIQGEGYDTGTSQSARSRTHFNRFLGMYKKLKASKDPIALKVHTDPTTDTNLIPGEKPRQSLVGPARWVAMLLNLRYRLMLAFIQHHLLIDGRSRPAAERQRQFLAESSIGEMHIIAKLAEKLVTMKGYEKGNWLASPTFELPYTLSLPGDEASRRKSHLEVLDACAAVMTKITPDERGTLERIAARDMVLRQSLQGNSWKGA